MTPSGVVRTFAAASFIPGAARAGSGAVNRREIEPQSLAARTDAALSLVGLSGLMERTVGRPEICVALIDGPVLLEHRGFAMAKVRALPGGPPSECARSESSACVHGTFVAGMLWARRDAEAAGICPGCSFLVRPVFREADTARRMPLAEPEELAAAIISCLEGGARILNISAGLAHALPNAEFDVEEALAEAARQGAIVVAAAGNDGLVGSTAITRHPAVIAVTACDLAGRPLRYANLGSAIGRRGLAAPGDEIPSLSPDGRAMRWSGTSVATPFVTGAVALLWSMFPDATVEEVKFAVTQPLSRRRASVVPPLLDVAAAHRALASSRSNTRRR